MVSVWLEVFLFMIIFISIILLIGEKKWMLMKFLGCFEVWVSEVIGNVEVLDV